MMDKRWLGLISIVFVSGVACADDFGVSAAPAPAAAQTQTTPAQTITPAITQAPANANATFGTGSTPAVDPNDINEQAFAAAARNLMPLTPEQIRALRYMFDQSQQAANTYPGVPPKPTSSSVVVNLSPGASPPVIRLGQGYVTSLVFLDATGAAWPVAATDLGNPKSFNIQWDKKGNTLLVQALDRYQSGNLAVMLRGMDTPVMLTLMPGQKAIDYRVDLRVPRIGPNPNPAMQVAPGTGSAELVSVLDGIPPNGAKTVNVEGGDCQGWVLGNRLFLRTSMTVLSPAWVSVMTSSDGTHAYELQITPIVLASVRGNLIKLKVTGL